MRRRLAIRKEDKRISSHRIASRRHVISTDQSRNDPSRPRGRIPRNVVQTHKYTHAHTHTHTHTHGGINSTPLLDSISDWRRVASLFSEPLIVNDQATTLCCVQWVTTATTRRCIGRKIIWTTKQCSAHYMSPGLIALASEAHRFGNGLSVCLSLWLAQLVKALAAPTLVRSCV